MPRCARGGIELKWLPRVMMMMSLPVPPAQVFFLRAGTRIGLVGEEVVDDGGGRRRMKIIENPEVQ